MVNIAKKRALVNNHHHHRRGNSNTGNQKKLQFSKVSLVILVLFVLRNFWSGGSDEQALLDGAVGRRTDTAAAAAGDHSQTLTDRTLETSRNDEASSTPMTGAGQYSADDVSAGVVPDSQFQGESDDDDNDENDDNDDDDDDHHSDDTSIGSVLDDKDRGMNDWLLQNAVLPGGAPSATETTNSTTDDSLSSPLLDDKNITSATDDPDSVVDHQLNNSLSPTTPTFAVNETGETLSLVPYQAEQNQTVLIEANNVTSTPDTEDDSRTRNATEGLDDPNMAAVAEVLNSTGALQALTTGKDENSTVAADDGVDALVPNTNDTPAPTMDTLAKNANAISSAVDTNNSTLVLLESPPVTVNNVTASNSSSGVIDLVNDATKVKEEEEEQQVNNVTASNSSSGVIDLVDDDTMMKEKEEQQVNNVTASNSSSGVIDLVNDATKVKEEEEQQVNNVTASNSSSGVIDLVNDAAKKQKREKTQKKKEDQADAATVVSNSSGVPEGNDMKQEEDKPVDEEKQETQDPVAAEVDEIIVNATEGKVDNGDASVPLTEKKKKDKKPKKGKKKKEAPSVLPNVIIAGAQKGGTTSIARYLNWTHAACFSEPTGISQGEGKESHFFDNWRIYNSSGLPYYENIFQHCHDQPLIVDATPEYMKNAQRIYDTYTEHGSIDTLKIIFTIREPVSREISWYNHRLRDCKTQQYAKAVCHSDGTPKPFKEVANKELVARLQHDDLKNMYSTYARYLELFFRLFKRNQIIVLSYDELQSDQKGFLRRIHKFLNLSGRPKALPHVNSDFGTHEDPPCDVQRALAKRYEPLNENLYNLLKENPGPKAEEKPFRKFHNKCFDEKYDEDEPDPFIKAQSKHIIPNVLLSGGDEPLISSTAEYLRQFKNGCGPVDVSDEKANATVVSPNFFDNSNTFKRGVQFYEYLFEHCESAESLVVDGTPELIKYPRRVREIYESKGIEKDVRFVFSLREPVRREIMAYQMKASKCYEDRSLKNTVCQKGKTLSFNDFAEKHVFSKIENKKLDYQGGLYAQYLKLWFKVWDRKQILILRHEESESDPKAYAGRILKFLDIGGKHKGTHKFRPSVLSKHDSVETPSCKVEKRLSKMFKPFNSDLYKLLKKNPGPKMEQSPFPIFTHDCETQKA